MYLCQILQEFMNRNKESDVSGYKIPDLQLVDLKDLLQDLKNNSEEIEPCWRYFMFIEFKNRITSTMDTE